MSHYCADHGWETDEARIACLDATEDQLIGEIKTLRSRVAELEAAIREHQSNGGSDLYDVLVEEVKG